MTKRVEIDGKEKIMIGWDEFWNHVKNTQERIKLEEEKDGLEVYISAVTDYVRGEISRNWYRVTFTHKRVPTDGIINRVRYYIDKYKVLSILKTSHIKEVFIRYAFPEHDDDLQIEITFLTYSKTKDLDMLIMPIYRILKEVEEYFKEW